MPWERTPDTVRGPDVIDYDKRVRGRDLNPRYSDVVPPLVVRRVLSPNDRMWARSTPSNCQVPRVGSSAWSGWPTPDDSTIAVYRADRALMVCKPEEELTGDEILPGFRHRVGDFFIPPGGDEEDAPET